MNIQPIVKTIGNSVDVLCGYILLKWRIILSVLYVMVAVTYTK